MTSIPNYGGLSLKDVRSAGGSNDARIAAAGDGRLWFVKSYRGDRDRVATELLSNAIYRALGVPVADAGTLHDGDVLALAYPLIKGGFRLWSKPSAALAEGFVADALLANWDVLGPAQLNVLWVGETPFRLDQGGTLEYQPQGSRKPFGTVPAELWTMNEPGGQAFGRMAITDAGLRAQSRDAELRLTAETIDALADAAPFTDEAMRERVRAALKARVGWLGRFGAGVVSPPNPNRARIGHGRRFPSIGSPPQLQRLAN